MRSSTVSIPLKSGHRFNATRGKKLDADIRLNPFEIRASVQPTCSPSPTHRSSLNPFEIRASVQRKTGVKVTQVSGLNPFEIRASVQQTAKTAKAAAKKVSIPLKSGHRFNWPTHSHLLCCTVSIPLKSGHRFNNRHALCVRQRPRLNPFEIRASVQHKRRVKWD